MFLWRFFLGLFKCKFVALQIVLHYDRQKNLVSQFNNNTITDNNNNVADNFIHSKYFDIDEIQKLKIVNKEKYLSLFFVNTCSLSKTFDELQHLLKITKKILMLLQLLKQESGNKLIIK